MKLYESINKIERFNNIFKINTSKGIYKTKSIIIATGFYDKPFMLEVPGETLPKVKHYYSEPHPYFGMNLVVVGSANSAVDVALETYRKGAKSVTMIIREKEIGSNVKYWARPDILNRIKEGSIKAYFEASIVEIHEDFVIFKYQNIENRIKNDFVLAMTGYEPNFEMLEQIGIEFNEDEFKTPKYNSKTMESNISNIYLAGVVCGGYKTNKWFIENSRVHAQIVINTITSKS